MKEYKMRNQNKCVANVIMNQSLIIAMIVNIKWNIVSV
jgi:hypothetical protein